MVCEHPLCVRLFSGIAKPTFMLFSVLAQPSAQSGIRMSVAVGVEWTPSPFSPKEEPASGVTWDVPRPHC